MWQMCDYACVSMDADLVSRVAVSTGLPPAEAARVVADVVAFFSESIESYVRRRHHQLQTCGVKNAEIFSQITAELAGRVVACPPLSQRQLRRIVYG